ncbi:MAG: hypothetical protein H7A19_03880 [Rhodanobacteraceae bacterium]|nr:hypothetical protein [Rhodanobacteraceae bacterium]
MSYDFSLRIPADLRKRGRKGEPHPDQLRRIARAREILQAFEPEIRFDDDDGMFTAFSAELGDVYVSYDRIGLAMSMGADVRTVYAAIHGLLKRFHTEGYEAVDPQIGGAISYRESFADFMRQYREHFRCPDEEFEQWCRGEDPPAWAEQGALRERGEAQASTAFPRCEWELGWQQLRTHSDDALWAHLQDVTRRVDEQISAFGLADYLKLLSVEAQSDQAVRRVDGSYYPESMATTWFQGSLFHYEQMVLQELKQRGHAALLRDRPQHLTLVFDLDAGHPISNEHADAVRTTMIDVIARLKGAGLVRSGTTIGQGNCWSYFMYGDDVDAIHEALVEIFANPTLYQPTAVAKRYGEPGSREVELAFAAVAR